MKFEICERVISESTNFFYIRLFMINQYQLRLEKVGPDSPVKLSPAETCKKYKNFIFELINCLKMKKHVPGDRVI